MIVFVTNRFVATPRRIGEVLYSEHRVIRRYTGDKKVRCEEDDLVVNWGCTNAIKTTSNARVLNADLCVSKTEQLRKFSGVMPTLRFGKGHPDLYPVLWRRDKSFGGRHIHLCRNFDEYRGVKDLYRHGFWVEYVSKVFEFRVHVVGDKLAFARKKIKDESAVAWNNHAGGTQNTFKNKTLNYVLGNLALLAVSSVGYDFGAVDIIMDGYGRLCVLEVNSAPSVSAPEDRIQMYAGYFDSVAKECKGGT